MATTPHEFFAVIDLPGVKLRVTTAGAGNNRRVDSGTSYLFDDTLTLGQIRQRFSSVLAPTEIPRTVNVRVDNSGGRYDAFHGFGNLKQQWEGRTVTIKRGGADGDDWSTMAGELVGRIKAGSFRADENQISFDVFDLKASHNKPILTTRIDNVTFPDAEDKAKGRYVPIVYGDFTSTGGPSTGGQLPAYATVLGASAAANSTFVVADHAISDLAVYHNGTLQTVTTHYTEDLANGGFVLLGTGSGGPGYDPSTDVVTVNCKGILTSNDGRPAAHPISGGAGTYELAADIAYDLLIFYGGAVAADIDSASWIAADGDGDGHNNRRWIGEQTKVMDAVGDLVFENRYLVFITDDKYKLMIDLPPKFFDITVGADTPVKVKQINDPHATYTNEIFASFDGNPVDSDAGAYWDAKTITNANAVTVFGDTIRREIVFNWLYARANVSRQAELKLLLWASDSHMVEIELVEAPTVTADGLEWSLSLGDMIRLTHWQYDAAMLQVRDIKKDPATGLVRATCFAVAQSFRIGQWGDADPPTSAILYPIKWKGAVGDSIGPSGVWA